jgi:hypothetical protein
MKKLLLGLAVMFMAVGAGAAQAECVPHRVITVIRPPVYAAPVVRVGIVAPIYTPPVYTAPLAYTAPDYPAPVVANVDLVRQREAWLRLHHRHEVVEHVW